MTKNLIPTEQTVQEERNLNEIKLLLLNGKVTLNGKEYKDLNASEMIIFQILIIQEKANVNQILNE